MNTSLAAGTIEKHAVALNEVDREFAARYPGESGARQPVHTVYGGAQLFGAETAQKLGTNALRVLDEHAPDPATLADVVGLQNPSLAGNLYARVREKLEREPVEDIRIDFEDGYGNRPDAEEDGHAVSTAQEVVRAVEQGTLPPFCGIRIKPLSGELRHRAIRTLDLFVTTLVRGLDGALPPNFVVTLPKVTVEAQVTTLATLLGELERTLHLPARALALEIMVEMPQAIIAADGTCPLPRLVEAGDGRCIAAHFGTYDYTAGCNITAAHQHMAHPSCDFAKHALQVALAGTGVWISDGATNIMPVGPQEVVHAAWRVHSQHVRHSLVGGYYQGWDLHPAQLPTRFATVFAFFLEGLDTAAERLRNFVERAAQATLVGDVFDDAATGQGLLNFFLRAINCGAISEEQAAARTGVTLDELHSRSFVKILASRRAS